MNRWTSESYKANAAYVPALGGAVFDLLNPQPGERILDIGCGDGTLTERIVRAGAIVVGVDASEDMVAAARARPRRAAHRRGAVAVPRRVRCGVLECRPALGARP